MRWRPSLGAWSEDEKTSPFPRVGSTTRRPWRPSRGHPVGPFGDRTGEIRGRDLRGESARIRPGDLYGYRVDGQGPFPDPASRYQPAGVHGPSRVVDADPFAWTDVKTGRNPARTNSSSMSFTSEPSHPRGPSPRHLDGCPTWPGWGSPRSSSCPSPIFPAVGTGGMTGSPSSHRPIATAPPTTCGTWSTSPPGHGCAARRGLQPLRARRQLSVPPQPLLHLRGTPDPLGARRQPRRSSGKMVREFFIENALRVAQRISHGRPALDATHAMVDEGPRHFLAELADRIGQTRRVDRSTSSPRITATWRACSSPSRRAVGAWMACGRTTSTTNFGACWPATMTASTATSVVGRRPRHDAQSRLALSRRVFDPSRKDARHRSVRARSAELRILHPEPRPDRNTERSASDSTSRSTSRPTVPPRQLFCVRPGRRSSSWARNGRRLRLSLFFTDHEEELGRKVPGRASSRVRPVPSLVPVILTRSGQSPEATFLASCCPFELTFDF